MNVATKLEDLVGEHVLNHTPLTDVRHPFDADASGIAFTLDDNTYFVFEDDNDGYRSAAGPLLGYAGALYELGGHGGEYCKIAVVGTWRTKGLGTYDYGAAVLELRDAVTGDLLLEVGTENVDDYYPSFIARWTPPTR